MDAEPQDVVDQYEALRREALEVAPFGPRGHGLALLLARGLPAALGEAARGVSRELGAPRWPNAAEA